MNPEHMPQAVGERCWTLANVQSRLSPIAQLSESKVDWFLATHSPIKCLSQSGQFIAEADLFEQLYKSESPEQLVVIKGPPGAGKSQLINWLRLRFEDALVRGELRSGKSKLRTVLIRRRSGSLKDALEQLVDQLPEYERFLAEVKGAIAQISADQARYQLSFYISVALKGLKENGKLPDDLSLIHQVFQDIKMTELFCSAGSVIDKNIQRLVNESDVQNRESLPVFTADDFDFRGKKRGQSVDTLMLDLLEDDESLRVECASVVNSVLRESIANVTGIKGQTLHEVFRGIRRAMMQAGEELALFIEDVSTMSILDEELVNALEPQGDTDLCKMLSVLGMTIPAYNRLQENKKDRITLALEIQGDIGNIGSLANEEEVDRFVGRYLNALRVGESQISVLAEDRRRVDEVQHSACDDCTLREKCFQAFSSVTLGEVEIGLYPLAPGAASRLMAGLDVSHSSRNPRGLLRHIVLPLLETVGNGSRTSSSLGINIKPQAPIDLSLASQTVLGGWTSSQRNQLSYLSWYWSGQQAISEARSFIEPMLPWFSLPGFSGDAILAGPHKTSVLKIQAKVNVGSQITSEDPQSEPQVVTPALQNARQRLQLWFDQDKKLTKDAEYRELLIEVLKVSLNEENTRTPSFAMQEFSSNGSPLTTRNILIEGMEASPAGGTKVRFYFPRNQSTYDLLNALLDFKHLGRGKTWDFEGGINQQRIYARWLLHNRERMLQSYDVTSIPAKDVQIVASAFLIIALRFCRRITLPNDTASAVETISTYEVGDPFTLTPTAKKLAADVVQRVPKIRDFLFRQLSVPQGGTRNLNFIDSRVMQEAVTLFRTSTTLPTIDNTGLPSEYPEISQLLQSDWWRLAEVLQEEHAQLRIVLDSLRGIIAHWNIENLEGQSDNVDLTQSVRIFLESARAAEKACANASQSTGREDLQKQIRELTPAKVTSWVACIEGAVKSEAIGADGILSLDISPVIKLFEFIQEIDKAMRQLAKDVADAMKDVVTEEEVNAERELAAAEINHLRNVLESVNGPNLEDIKHDD
jgi:hypothetical protein